MWEETCDKGRRWTVFFFTISSDHAHRYFFLFSTVRFDGSKSYGRKPDCTYFQEFPTCREIYQKTFDGSLKEKNQNLSLKILFFCEISFVLSNKRVFSNKPIDLMTWKKIQRKKIFLWSRVLPHFPLSLEGPTRIYFLCHRGSVLRGVREKSFVFV